MILEKKIQEKGKIIEVEGRVMISVKDKKDNECPFPDAEVGDLLYFKIRAEFSRSTPKYEFIIDISKHFLKTERINPNKRRVEIMNYAFEDYIHYLGDFFNEKKPIEIIEDPLEYQRIESNMKNLGIRL